MGIKTLVIHPIDPTTKFLSIVYKGHEDWSILRHYPGEKTLHKLIRAHDRIIILSHGDSDGMGDLKTQQYWITSKSVQFLLGKEVIGIWCYASDFFRKYKIKGFATGMFISELDEAYLNCVTTTEEAIDESAILFSEILNKYYDKYDKIIEEYDHPTCPVINFNKELLEIFF